jgi:hypothetical protein
MIKFNQVGAVKAIGTRKLAEGEGWVELKQPPFGLKGKLLRCPSNKLQPNWL